MSDEFSGKTTENPSTHWLSPFDADLDDLYSESPLVSGFPILWALAFPVNDGAWQAAEQLVEHGKDWSIVIVPEGEWETPNPKGEDIPVETAVCVISVETGVTHSVNRARDIGMPAVRQVAGLVNLITKLIVGKAPLWEGPIAVDFEGNQAVAKVGRYPRVIDYSRAELDSRFTQYIGFAAVDSRKDIGLSLFWYSRAWEAADLVGRFMNFWLACLALIEARRKPKDSQRDAIGRYVSELQAQAVFSAAKGDAVRAALDSAYTLRNQIFHESEWSSVTVDAVTELENSLSFCLNEEIRVTIA